MPSEQYHPDAQRDGRSQNDEIDVEVLHALEIEHTSAKRKGGGALSTIRSLPTQDEPDPIADSERTEGCERELSVAYFRSFGIEHEAQEPKADQSNDAGLPD